MTGFVAGLFLGAVPTAFALLVVGSLLRAPLPPDARRGAAALAVAVLLLREVGLFRFPVPQNARQVPQFVTRIPFWGALQFGAEMGTGMRTFSPTGWPHAVAILLLLLASWPEALTAGLGFALGRALMLLTFLTASDQAAAATAFDRLPRLERVFALLAAPLMAVLIAG